VENDVDSLDYVVEKCSVADVAFDHGDVAVRQSPTKVLPPSTCEVVKDNDFGVPALDEHVGQMRTDEARAAGD
jgi:hypothetical protein